MTQRCSRCDAQITHDQRASICSPCARQGSHDEPAQHPIDFWQHDRMHDALATRHFGAVLNAYRAAHQPPLSQATLARWLGLTQAQVSRMERARTAPSDLRKLQRWAETLKIPPSALWFSSTHGAPLEEEPAPPAFTGSTPGEEQPEHSAASPATVPVFVTNPPWQRLADSLAGRHAADPATVEAIEQRTAEHFYAEQILAAERRMVPLRRHRDAVYDALEATSQQTLRRRLLSSLGETQALCGLASFDMQRPRAAAPLFRQALESAREAEDSPLAACTLGFWSIMFSSNGDHRTATQMLAEAARQARGSAAELEAWLCGHLAEQLASTGNAVEALRSLDRAMTVFDYASMGEERGWSIFITAGRMGTFAVSTYAALGHEDTDLVAESLLGSMPGGETKNRALALTELAVWAARSGDYDRVGEYARPAIELALRTQFTLAIDKLWNIVEMLRTDTGTPGRVRDELADQLLTDPEL